MDVCLGDETIAAYVDGALELDAVVQIDHHIDTCATCRSQLSAVAASPVMHSFVSDVAGSAADVVAAVVLARPGDALPELAIGRYLVERLIGRGGMGVVVRARDPELERAVAIKLVDPLPAPAGTMVSGGWRSRLRAEARAMARLRHPNVVAVYDAGAVGNHLFVAMELVDGESLARHLAAGDRSRAIDLCIAAGRGLCAAHAAGLVHGDVKPDNILVDRDGRTLIGDFGLVRTIAERVTTGGVAGTPAYMAPELLRGKPADPQSDQFAFAVTIYEAVAGRRPWHAESLGELAKAMQQPPERPAAMSRSVWRVVARGLSADPAARFPSLAEFVTALERAHVGRARTWLVAGAGVAVAAGIAITAIALRSAPSVACTDPVDRVRAIALSCGAQPSEPCAALAAAIDKRAAAWRATHVGVCTATRDGTQSAELLDRRMRCLDDRLAEYTALLGRIAAPVKNADAFDALAALHRLDPPEQCATFDRTAPIPPAAQAAAIDDATRRVAAARADHALGHYRAGRDALAPQFAAIRALGYAPLVADAAKVLGDLQTQAGDAVAAETTFDIGLRAAAEAGDDRATASLLLDFAYLVGVQRQQWTRGAELLRTAELAVVRAGKPAALESLLELEQGIMAEDAGDYATARTHYTRGLELRRASGDSGEVALALQRLCAAEHMLGKLDDARAHCQEAVGLVRETLGASHPLVAEAESNLAVAIAIQGNLVDARQHWQRALEILETGLGDDAPALVVVLLDLDDVSRELGDAAAADRYLARALKLAGTDASNPANIDIQLRVAKQLRTSGKAAEGLALDEQLARRAAVTLGAYYPITGHALEDLAAAYYESDRFADARATYEKLLALSTKLYGEHHPTTLSTAGRYGQAMMAMNDYAAACPVFERAMLALETEVKPDSAVLASAYTNMADCLTARGDAKRAVEPAQKALAIFEKRGDDPLQTAEARFVYARSLWSASKDPQAVAAAKQARQEMKALAPRATSLPDVERWLAGKR